MNGITNDFNFNFTQLKGKRQCEWTLNTALIDHSIEGKKVIQNL